MQHADTDNDYSFIADALYAVLDFKEKNENDSNRSDGKQLIGGLSFYHMLVKQICIQIKVNRAKLDWLDRSVSKHQSDLFL